VCEQADATVESAAPALHLSGTRQAASILECMTEAAIPGQRALGSGLDVLPETVLAVFNGIPGLVGYWDRECRNVLANDAYLEWFGKTPAEVRGRHAREVVGQELFERNRSRMERALAGEEQVFDRAITDASGRQRWTQTSYIPDARGGEVQGFFVLVTDITARVVASRAARRTVDQHRALARSLPSGFVLVFDESLRYSLADGVELSAFGVSRRALEGRTLHEAVPPHLVAEVEPHYRTALAGGTTSWERQVGSRVFRLTAGPVLDDDDEVIAGMVTALDVTEDRMQEKAWRALAATARDVARNASTAVVAEDVTTSLADIFDVPTAVVVRFTGPHTATVVAMTPKSDSQTFPQRTFDIDEQTAAGRVLATGRVATVHYDAQADGVAGRLLHHGHRSGAAVPVRSGSELWGAVCVASRHEDGIDRRLVDRLGTFAELVELSVASSRSLDALEREAHTDALTGLPNRRAFDERLAREVEISGHDTRPLAVAIMDVDHFKSVNDAHGHPVGDTVLADLAARVSTISRDHDLVARVGGEEFGWIMPGTTGEQAVEAAERLRADVSRRPFGDVGFLTVSIGVCALADAGGPEDLVTRADEALYAAKRGGRDQVRRADPPSASSS